MIEATIFVEVSIGYDVGVAGWAATLLVGSEVRTYGGTLRPGLVDATLAELVALHEAVRHAAGLPEGCRLHIATRSTAAMAVLRWVFKDAPQGGYMEVAPPKKLAKHFVELPELYSLDDLLDLGSIQVQLKMVQANPWSDDASAAARRNMERARRECA